MVKHFVLKKLSSIQRRIQIKLELDIALKVWLEFQVPKLSDSVMGEIKENQNI